MPVGAIIGAAGAVAGGVSSKKGAKKAAKIQAQSQAEQRRMLQSMYNQNEARFRPEFQGGTEATARLKQLLGLSGSKADPTQILRNTAGYKFRMGEALRGVNSNAYSRGLGNSGATQKALLATAHGVADQTFNNYFNQVSSVADRGLAAKSAMAGVSQNFTNSYNNVLQQGADTQAGYQMFKAENFNNMLGGVLRGAGQAFGSSFAPNGALIDDVNKTMRDNGGIF